MTEQEWQEEKRHAREVAAQPGLRRAKLILFVVAACSVAVFLGAAAATYFGQRTDIEAGELLADRVSAACSAGVVVSDDPAEQKRLCGLAEDVRAEVKAGPQGIAGTDGRDGVDGVDGADGSPGPSGAPGRPGRNGRNGADGADSLVPGPSGAAGSPGADSTVPGPQGMQGERGERGEAGRGVTSVECSTSGAGEYTFHYRDGTSETVTCEPEPDPQPPSSAGPVAARR